MDRDRLAKELLTTFFVEFLELFFPALVQYLDRESIEFLDKEVFTDITEGDRREVDLLVKARFQGQSLFFLIHVENQAQPQAEFARRMFAYFARLHEKHGLPVYPIALFSYDEPQKAEPDEYRVEFSDLDVLTFRFRVVQLNRLDWHNFVERTNPIAAALMAKMRMEPAARPVVKLACLNMLAKLQLDPEQQEGVMEIVTSWMEQGKQNQAQSLVLRQLRKQLGSLQPEAENRLAELSVEQLEELAEAFLDFTAPFDLTAWLDAHCN